MNTRRVDEYLKRLKTQERYLEKKLDEAEEEKSHYLIAELLALQWAIKYIEDTFMQAVEHQTKYFNETRQNEQNQIHTDSGSSSSAVR